MGERQSFIGNENSPREEADARRLWVAGEGPETRLGSLGSGGMTPRGGEREFCQAKNN